MLADTLAAYAVRLRLRAVVGPAEGPAALAQAFEDRVLLDDTAQVLAVAHQKLLSLYPAVGADLAEAARRAAADARARASADDPADDLAAFAARIAALTDRLAAA